jgi:hypothetical protein
MTMARMLATAGLILGLAVAGACDTPPDERATDDPAGATADAGAQSVAEGDDALVFACGGNNQSCCSGGRCNGGGLGCNVDNKCRKPACAGVNCGSHGSCSNGFCQCRSGFTGKKCQNAADACAGINCGAHGSCSRGACSCRDGFTGNRCQTAPDPCAGINCGAHGSCSRGSCLCRDGFSGNRCQNSP